MFVDATFDIVPHPFYQCLIIMIFDARLKIFIPVAWILMSGKTDKCYWQAFAWFTSTVEDLDPAFCGVDFEIAFFRQVAVHLLFHWKQAIRRKIIKLKIPDDEVRFAMRRGVIDLLTIVPKDDVHPIGTTYVASKIMDYCAENTNKVLLRSMRANLMLPSNAGMLSGMITLFRKLPPMLFCILFTNLSKSVSSQFLASGRIFGCLKYP